MTADLKRDLKLLKVLHDLDYSIIEIEEKLDELPGRRDSAQADYLTLKSALDEKQRARDEAEKTKRSEELELAAEVERIKERETRLYAIKTNKEYQAALKEIADGKKANREREERVLALMEAAEAAAKEITQLSGKVADIEGRSKEAVRAIDEEGSALEAERNGKSREREGVVRDVGRDVIRVYEHVRQRYRDAVAEVRQGICQGCNMKIPPQQFLELQKWVKLSQCPSCHRILCPADDVETGQTG